MSKRKTPNTSSPDARTVIPGREVAYHNAPALGNIRFEGDRAKLGDVRRDPKSKKHQRRIRISVVLPASVELIVGTNDADPNEDTDWEILSVHNIRCEATPRTVSENMHDGDFEALATAAANAEDLP